MSQLPKQPSTCPKKQILACTTFKRQYGFHKNTYNLHTSCIQSAEKKSKLQDRQEPCLHLKTKLYTILCLPLLLLLIPHFHQAVFENICWKEANIAMSHEKCFILTFQVSRPFQFNSFITEAVIIQPFLYDNGLRHERVNCLIYSYALNHSYRMK